MARLLAGWMLLLLLTPPLLAQDETAAEVPVIADEPRSIDPATLMPKPLAAKGTVEFDGESLLEMAQWFADEHDLKVLFDKRSLDSIGVPLGEPVYDRLEDEPLYLLLGRLSMHGLTWYYDDGLVRITSLQEATSQETTVPYNLGDLIDKGFSRNALFGSIVSTIDVDSWADNGGGLADIQWLGDVMFVRQTGENHRRLEGLLTALRGHGRQTFIFDPPQHTHLRQKLDEPITIKLDQAPLVVAVERLAEVSGVDLRLDRRALKTARLSEREPVSLDLEDRQLRTVLQVAFSDFSLTWMMRDGVLWLTSEKQALAQLKTAVYDVRDLCSDESEGEALIEAILSQMPENWSEHGAGDAEIRFAKVGTMVVSQNEAGHEELLELLERYRAALRISKPRKADTPDPEELLTQYYRLPREIAEELEEVLPRLVDTESWKSEEHPEAEGTILVVASQAQVSAGGEKVPLVVPHSVLIVKQSRKNHEVIADLLYKIRHGDTSATSEPKGLGGGGFGGGGFGGGGGAFSVPKAE